jgi:hypothetical protein
MSISVRKYIGCLSLVLFLLLGCKGKTGNSENALGRDETNASDSERRTSTNYKYPENIFQELGTGEDAVSMYAIGFSSNGNFAYINRPCNGGCGCCTHEVVIQDLFSDKKIHRVDISKSNVRNENSDDIQDFNACWKYNFSKVRNLLIENGIRQINLRINKSDLIKIGNDRYQISFSKKIVNDFKCGAGPGESIDYYIVANLNNTKSKTISKGNIFCGYDMEYLGYVKSPFSNQIALFFNELSYGFEAEKASNVKIVGCMLDPSYF